MSSFFYCTGSTAHADSSRIQSRLSSLGMPLARVLEDEKKSLFVHITPHERDAPLLQIDDASFIFRTGLFLYKGTAGTTALQAFFEDFDPDAPDINDTQGQFCLALRKNNQFFILTDQLGTNKIYYDETQSVFSNRFIGVAETLSNPVIDPQGCYEYAWNNKISGEKTFLKNIRMVPAGTYVKGGEQPNFAKLPKLNILDDTPTDDIDALVDLHVGGLQTLFQTYAKCFGDDINLLMSGGYDSRLLLSLLLDNGVKPSLTVFGDGTDAEARVVKDVGIGEGLSFSIVDKSNKPQIPLEDYAHHLEQNYAFFDGWKFTGLFDGGADIWDRKEQAKSGKVKMNGSVGEIYRNFFYLPDRPINVADVVGAFYARYDPKTCTDQFDPAHFETLIGQDIKAAIGASGDLLSRQQVEMVYPLFRGRYWTARDVPTNQEFGGFLVPFMEPGIIKGTPSIPISLKNYGRFEGRMIRRINPRLAAYMSDYGFSFSQDPPMSYVLKMQLTHQRPIALRRQSYRIQHRKMPSNRPYYFSQDYLQNVLQETDFPFMQQFFKLDGIRDGEVFNRVATMEYICQRLNTQQP